METLTTGTGIAAMGFWLFVGLTVLAGVWDSIRKRDAQHETLRRVIESGEEFDEEMVDRLITLAGGSKNLERDMWFSGLTVASIAPAMAIFGWVMSIYVEEKLLPIMLSVAALLLFLGIGFLGVSRLIRRWDTHNQLTSTL